MTPLRFRPQSFVPVACAIATTQPLLKAWPSIHLFYFLMPLEVLLTKVQ